MTVAIDAGVSPLQIERVLSYQARETFIGFPNTLYRECPHWVSHLRIERRKTLDPRNNPFFEHGHMELFLAWRDGAVVGRIAAIRDDAYVETHHKKTGFFGFFESIDDQSVADRLFGCARTTVQGFGMDYMLGPMSPSANTEAGLLVEGFDDAPRFMMPYNPPYYEDLFLNAGLRVEKQLLAYKIHRATVLASAQIDRVARFARERHGLTVRPLDMGRYHDEIHLIRHLYNAAWRGNWGFVPITEAEAGFMAKNLRFIIEPSLVLFAEVGGNPVGVALVLRDYNRILAAMDGKLLPWGWFRLLTGKSRIDWLRLLLIGILPEWRNRGFDAALYREIAISSTALGVDNCEGSWVLEDNESMNRIMPALGGEIYKRYNVYGTDV